MYQLYYSPGACSLAVHIALIECGAQFTLMDASIQAGKTQSPEFLKINPRGQVPVLVEDGKAMTEGGAILAYLCDKHKSALLPQSGWERAQALQWLMFANSTMHPAYSKAFGLMRNQDKVGAAEFQQMTMEQINGLWAHVENKLQNQSYLCGEQCTIGDILLCVIANWSGYFGDAIQIGGKTKAMFQRVIARPACQQAMQAEHVEYKAAA